MGSKMKDAETSSVFFFFFFKEKALTSIIAFISCLIFTKQSHIYSDQEEFDKQTSFLGE